MKGIILAGGSGSRLSPLTFATSKQLLPIYDKPMIYYPLSVFMLLSIREILIISTPKDLPRISELLGDGKHLGLSIQYKAQEKPDGIAQAFILGKDFIDNEPVSLILGDNFFYGHHLAKLLDEGRNIQEGALIYAYHVQNPASYGIVTFDKDGEVIALEEKPKNPTSHWAITGIYFYDGSVYEKAKRLEPSKRGELEITDLNLLYLQEKKLYVRTFWRGYTWLDAGTPDALIDASHFVQTIEKRQGFKVACLEEIALNNGFISKETLINYVEQKFPQGQYGDYIRDILRTSK